jgi:glycosyltransferase involved in cell wall biosynthesis
VPLKTADHRFLALKVLHIGKYFPPHAGGMEHYLRDLMVEQSRRGTSVDALVHRSEISASNRVDSYESDGQSFQITRAAVWARLLFTPLSPAFPWLLRRLIATKSPDILHFHMPNASAFWALLSPAARRLPWVVHWHSDVVASRYSRGLSLFYSFYRPFERSLLRRSDMIIATSTPYLESSKTLADFRTRCAVVPLGLKPDPVSAIGAAPSINPLAPLRVLAVGRLTYYKGFDQLIRATAQLDNVETHIVGEGELANELKTLARAENIADRVTFHGKLTDDELARHYELCDCLCLPSVERTEAFGLVLLEAMSHGRATVVTDVPGSGMGWVVDEGITGLKVAPGNTDELASALSKLEKDRGMMRRLGENGRRKFEDMFNIDKSCDGVETVYRGVLQQRSS